jgi:hypothetical protein
MSDQTKGHTRVHSQVKGRIASLKAKDEEKLSKRLLLAGMAMQGLLANGYLKQGIQIDESIIAHKALCCADELLKQEREQP